MVDEERKAKARNIVVSADMIDILNKLMDYYDTRKKFILIDELSIELFKKYHE